MNNLKEFSLSIEGISMYPYLKSGDRIWVDPTRIPKKGDLILFKCEKELVVHRFFDENLFKGDYQKNYDQEFGDHYSLLGTVTHHHYENKKILIYEGFLRRFLVVLSQRNHYTKKATHRFYSAGIRLVGHLIRVIEGRSFI
ncbi:MAG: S24/S26 family peptidase [Bacteriovoracaceae bacterium]|nr:S24/S26 family peptidase [Bacteriovoracaceae bacterium]